MRSIIPLAVALAACSAPPPRDRTVAVSPDDSAMAVAIRQARRTLPEFLAGLAEPPSGAPVAVKVRLEDDDEVEFVWLTRPEYRDGMCHGRINIEVQHVSTYKEGDFISVHADSIADWMMVRNDTMLGGFSIRLLAPQMTAAERAQLPFHMPPDSAWAP